MESVVEAVMVPIECKVVASEGTVAPIRAANLASIKLGENLIKPGGPHTRKAR